MVKVKPQWAAFTASQGKVTSFTEAGQRPLFPAIYVRTNVVDGRVFTHSAMRIMRRSELTTEMWKKINIW